MPIIVSPDSAQPCLSLKKHATELCCTKHKPVQVFSFNEQKYVMKCRQAARPRYLRSWAASATCALVFNEYAPPARLRAGDITHEANRLRKLRKRGARVPKVVLDTPDFMVLEYCGRNLTRVLKQLPSAKQIPLLVEVIDELVDFHRGGHWHGAAQLRNLTLHNNQIYRIDFEESAGTAVSLSVAQAYDVILTFHSMIDYLDGDIELGASLFDRYFQQSPSAGINLSLQRLTQKLGWWIKSDTVLRPLASRHKDVHRALMLIRLLKSC